MNDIEAKILKAATEALEYMVENSSYGTTKKGRIALMEKYLGALKKNLTPETSRPLQFGGFKIDPKTGRAVAVDKEGRAIMIKPTNKDTATGTI